MNDYFNYTPLTANTVARASDVNSRFAAVETGFELLPDPDVLAEDRATYAVDTGVANALLAAPTIPLTAYNTGLHIRIKAAAANTGAATINVSGLGVKQIVRSDGTPLQTGDIVANQILDMTYDGTAFRLAMAFAELSPAGVAAKLAVAGNITIGGTVTTTGVVINGQTLDGLTAFGVSLVEAANAAAGRTALGLGSMATQSASDYASLSGAVFTGDVYVDDGDIIIRGGTEQHLWFGSVPNSYLYGNTDNRIGFYNGITGFNWNCDFTNGYIRFNGVYLDAQLVGTPTAPTAASGTNNTQIATTQFVQSAIASGGGGFAPINSPTFTGTPSGPTAAPGTNTTQLSTTQFVTSAITALGIGNYAPINSPSFTGTPLAPTATGGTNTTQIASTAFVQSAITALSIGSYAPLASPTFTGTPTAPTAALDTNTTQVATTAYVMTKVAQYAPLSGATFTGTVLVPTAATADNSTKAATTAYVKANLADYLPLTGGTMTGLLTGPSVSVIAPSGAGHNSTISAKTGAEGQTFEVRGNGTGPATIVFHRPGSHAVYFGLDTDNQLKLGGWSLTGSANTIYHTGNISGALAPYATTASLANYAPKPIVSTSGPSGGGSDGQMWLQV